MEGKSLDDFSKARKYYGIFSAILISWSMVGIDVDSVQAVGSKITLKNPESIPYALIALVLYLSYRLSIEWAILDPQEKKNKFLRIDLFVSHSIGFLSVNSFLFFRALSTSTGSESVLFVVSVCAMALLIGLQTPMAVSNFKHSLKDRKYLFPALFSCFAIAWFVGVILKGDSSGYFLVIYLGLLFLGFLLGGVTHRNLVEMALNKRKQ